MNRFAVHLFHFKKIVNSGHVQSPGCIVLPEEIIQRRRGFIIQHFPRPEVDSSLHGTVYAAKIQD